MPIDNWDDDRIESMLRDFPSIRDERPKEEVYNKLADSKNKTVRKQPKRWLPMFVAALAFVTLGALAASFLGQNSSDTAMDNGDNSEAGSALTAAEEETEENAAADTEGSMESAEDSGAAEDTEVFTAEAMPDYRTAVYAEDLESYQLFTIGLTENALVIPVSFLIPSDKVLDDLGLENPDSLDLYAEYADEIDESALGFDDYHPYAGELGNNGESIEHRLPEGHDYDIASAAIGVYTESLRTTFNDFEQIHVLDEIGGPIEFSQVGPMDPISTSSENLAYFTFTVNEENTYLVPSYGMYFESASEAISEMATSPSELYQSAIPGPDLYEVSETDEYLTIEFIEPFDFDSMDASEATRMIESLALTGSSFGKRVQILNASESDWNGFDFSQPLPVPVSANRMYWE